MKTQIMHSLAIGRKVRVPKFKEKGIVVNVDWESQKPITVQFENHKKQVCQWEIEVL